ncbi:MAG: glycosyl hydrolase [Patescibacteria group bacterium]
MKIILNTIYKFLIHPIYILLRINLRIIVAIGLLVYLTYPVMVKVRDISMTNKPFFTTLASDQLKSLPQINLSKFNKGVYDPNNEHIENKSISINQIFHSWDSTSEQKILSTAIESSIKSQRRPYITIEPWADDKKISNEDYLRQILRGQYDNHIINTCRKISSFKELMLVNWGEGPDFGKNSRYAWATEDAELYINSYRYWYKICNANAKNIIYVWTAFGTKNSEKYYPGDDYVNLLGLNVQVFEKDIPKTNNTKREVTKYISNKLKLIKNINRFVYITNFAIENASKNEKFTKEFINTFNSQEFENILGILYTNTDQSPSMVEGVKSLDYTIDPNTFEL